VHPSYFKELARDKPIEDLPLPEKLVLPLSQSIGAPPEPLVERGDEVKKGQKIAESSAFVSAVLHSPVDGQVKSIGPHPTFTGAVIPCITIAVSEGLAPEVEEASSEKGTAEDVSPDEIRGLVKEAGLVGLGGAAFPTHVKLSPPPDKPIDSVIINGCECEPFLNVDFRLMVEETERLIDGFRLIMLALNASKGYVGIETNKPEAIEAVSKALDGEPNMEVIPLGTKYPQGSEKHLIKAILGREVPSGGLPFEVGAYVQNVQTTIAISKAVRERKPLTERVITVSGPGVVEPKNLRVKLGTLASEVVKFCGGLKENAAKVIFGGPMTGFALGELNVPIVKGTSGIVVLTEDMVVESSRPLACIRCGRCVEVCPVSITPFAIANFTAFKMWDKAEEYDVLDCIECGSCGFICPTRRPLVQLLKYAKAEILARKKAKAS
jgi:electron transport complex protein RnfC